MRKGWLALPALVCATACSPVKDYQEAARSLRFTLERVEPRVQFALPVDRSRIAFKLILRVENPSSVPFHVTSFEGALKLETLNGPVRSLGSVELSRPLELPAGGTARMETEVSFTYSELRENWAAIQSVAAGGAGAWQVEGFLCLEAYRLPIKLPVKSRNAFGGGA
jgi:LEA14-like dessication related protein